MPRQKGIIDFNRDASFYASHGKAFYNSADYLKAIKYFLNVPYTKKEYHDVAMMLAECYTRFQLADNALFVYYQLCSVCDDKEELALVYLKISEILFFFDKNLTKYYLCKVKDNGDMIVGQEAEFRLDKILETEREVSSRIKDVSEVSSDLQVKLLMEGKYDAVLELADKNNHCTPSMREAVELSYISLNKDKECLDYISSITSPLSIVELCIYYFCLSHNPNAKRIKEVRNSIKNVSDLDETKLPLCINILCLAGDSRLALDLTESHISSCGKMQDYRLQVFYAKLLLSVGSFDKAREILVEIKSIDTFHTAIYKELLDLCQNKTKLDPIQVMAILPYKNHAKIVKAVKGFFALDKEDVSTHFDEVRDCLYYVAENAPSREMVKFMTTLVEFEDDAIKDFVQFLLLSRTIDADFKRCIVLSLYKHSRTRKTLFTVDDVLIEYVFPPLESIKALPTYYFASISHSILYFLTSPVSMNFEKIFDYLPIIKIKRDEVMCMASYATFVLSTHLKPGTKLKDILAYYMISEKDFYAFLEKYNLEI